MIESIAVSACIVLMHTQSVCEVCHHRRVYML